MRALWQSGDARAGVVIAVLGAIYLAAALRIEPDPSAASVLGPRVAPIAIGLAAVAGAVALVVSAARRPAGVPAPDDAPAGAPGDAEADASGEPEVSRGKVLITFAMLAAYIVAFIPIGFIVATFCFLGGATTYYDRRHLVRNLVFAAVFAVVVYIGFTRGLNVALPPGVLG